MEFRLTYQGPLKAHRDDKRLAERSLHVHDIRKKFHKQLKLLWEKHPTLAQGLGGQIWVDDNYEKLPTSQTFKQDGFEWLPIVNDKNGLICKLQILMLRDGPPGEVLSDIDNRLKTLFDALRKANGPPELGINTSTGQVKPDADETPFCVLLEDDRLITHVAVTTDMLLEPVANTSADEAVRLVIDVTIRPYKVHMENLAFT
jgi:hypothetical protein